MKAIIKIAFLTSVGIYNATAMFGQDFEQRFDTTKISTQHIEPVQKQTFVIKPKIEKPINTEMSLGLRLNSDGWSVYTDYGKSRVIDSRHGDRFYNLRFFQFEVSEKKSPKELKSSTGTTNSTGGQNTYIFGKINNFYVIKLGYGSRKMIAGKTDNAGSVSVHWVNAGGFAAGFIKPYYLDISGAPGAIKYTDNEVNFLNPNQIVGSAGFSKGISEAVFVPGIYYRSAFHFDVSGNLRTVIAFEAGFDAEYFSKDVQIMANNPGTPYFVNVFLAFQFGRRW